MSRTKPVRIPVSLEEEFNRLPNRANWDPVGFPEFVREAVRHYLEYQKRCAREPDDQ